MEQGTFKKEQ